MWHNETVGLIGVWAHGYSGPMEGIGGVLGPLGRRKGLYVFYLIYSFISPDFLHVGLCASLAGDMASRDASDEITLIDSRRLQSTLITDFC